MLYIFRNNTGLEIAWNSVPPRPKARNSTHRRNAGFSLFGLIRTSSAG